MVQISRDKIEDKDYGGVVISAKAGGYHYFSKWIATRYYYNFEMNFTPGDAENSTFFRPVRLYDYEGYYIFALSHTLNADFIFNAYSKNNFEFGFITGIGLGLLGVEASQRLKRSFFPYKGNQSQSIRTYLNLGARLMFDQVYGLEFTSKVPLKSNIIDNRRDGSQVEITRLLYLPYSFSLDFVMQF